MDKAEHAQRRRVRSIARNLASKKPARSEQAREELEALNNDRLIHLVRVQLSRYREMLVLDHILRVGLAVMVCILCLAPLAGMVMLGLPVPLAIVVTGALVSGLLMLTGRRPAPGRRELAAMVWSLQAVRARFGETVELAAIWPGIDRTTLAKMRLRCPDLDPLLPSVAPPGRPRQAHIEFRLWHIKNRLRTPFEFVEYTLAALQDAEEIGDETFIPIVRELVDLQSARLRMTMPLDNPEAVRMVREAAEHCLAVLQARQELIPRTLLRGASAPGADTLLRASHSAGEDPAEQLLRASSQDE